MTKIYIAAPWVDRENAAMVAARFESEGFEITHKWWLVETEDTRPLEERSDYLREHAYLDWDGVMEADMLILIHSAKSEGKAVEQGIALMRGIPIVAIGERGYKVAANIFHWLPDYTWVSTVDEALELSFVRRS